MQFALAADEGSLAFYATAAQVIPIIFLALVFELRTLQTGTNAEQKAVWALYKLPVAVVLVAGEAAALFVIASGRPSETWEALIATTLIVGGSGLLIPIAVAERTTIRRGHRTTKAATNVAVAAVRVLLGLIVFATIMGIGWVLLGGVYSATAGVMFLALATTAQQLVRHVVLPRIPAPVGRPKQPHATPGAPTDDGHHQDP